MFEKFPKMARYNRDVIVTEKIDGTNAQIYISDEGEFLVGSRNRWVTPDSDNYGFARWAYENEEQLRGLGPGRHFGEWWGSGIQRGYGLKNGDKRFSLFNTTRWADDRPECCHVVPVIWQGPMAALDTDTLMLMLAGSSFAAPGFDSPEGIVVFHTAGRNCLKITYDHDDTGKWNV